MFSKHKHDGGHDVPTVDLDRPHVPLATFRVLYIGRAAPKATLDSMESIQKPLCELYTKDECKSRDTDVDAVLTVYTSGLLMEPVNQLDADLWLPVQNLQSCAAVKAVVQNIQGCVEPNQLAFFPVDSAQASKSPYPPIFNCVMGRSNGLPLTDCYAFICQSNDASLLAVQAMMHAFGNRRGWSNDRPPKRTNRAMGLSQCNQDDIVISEMDEMPAEFYDRPPIHGFFYTPSPSLIQKYHIQGDACSQPSGQPRSPYIKERPLQTNNQPVNPMLFFENDENEIFLDETVGMGAPIRIPQKASVRMRQLDPGQAFAFNPYLVPAADPLPPPPSQIVTKPVAIKTTTKTITTTKPAVAPAVVQKTVYNPGSYMDDEVVYQKQLPRSNNQMYANQDGDIEAVIVQNINGKEVRDGGYRMTTIRGPPPTTEEVYANRLPPPVQQPLPQGVRQFDSNFILQQSDTDKARIGDKETHMGYPVPMGISAADFGF